MARKVVSSKPAATKSVVSKPARTGYATISRPKPAKVLRTAVAPHVKTMANGQPRPTRRTK